MAVQRMKTPEKEIEKLTKELRKYADLSIKEVLGQKKEIMRLFDEFWSWRPTREEFAKAMSGLPIFPEMIYQMVRK